MFYFNVDMKEMSASQGGTGLSALTLSFGSRDTEARVEYFYFTWDWMGEGKLAIKSIINNIINKYLNIIKICAF